MHRNLIASCRAVVAAALVVTGLLSSVHAQQAGTIWLDFVPDNLNPANYPRNATIGNQSAFAGSLRNLNGLDTLTDAQVTAIETDVVNIVTNKFGGNSIAILSNAGDPAADPPAAPPGTNYTLVVLGDAGGAEANTLGLASQIDWRNLSFTDKIGISVAAFNGFTDPPGTVFTPTTVARALANTITHEIGHVLGLVHTDAAATYALTAGTDAQKKTATQNTDMMRANVTSFNSATTTTTAFNSYSQLKLDVAAHGILLENQAVQTAMGHPNTADPIARTADTNIDFDHALPLVPNETGMVNVLGKIEAGNAAKIDYFQFNGHAGQTVHFEVYSLGLEAIEGDTNSGRIPVGQAIGDNTLILVNALNNEIARSMFPTTTGGNTNYDGSTQGGNPLRNDYGDALLFGVTLPADGLYYLELEGSTIGQYELFAVVPEPSGELLVAIGILGYWIYRANGRRLRLSVV